MIIFGGGFQIDFRSAPTFNKLEALAFPNPGWSEASQPILKLNGSLLKLKKA